MFYVVRRSEPGDNIHVKRLKQKNITVNDYRKNYFKLFFLNY